MSFELFKAGTEDALSDESLLRELEIETGETLFMLKREGLFGTDHRSTIRFARLRHCSHSSCGLLCSDWRWDGSGKNVALMGEGAVAYKTRSDRKNRLATGGEPMTGGRHYWEVEITACNEHCSILLGVARPEEDHDMCHIKSNGACYINCGNGCLYGGYPGDGKYKYS